MMLPDSKDRGLPSVRDRSRAARQWQWLIVAVILMVLGGGGAWLLHNVRASWYGKSRPQQPDSISASRPSRIFKWSALAPTLPPPKKPIPLAVDNTHSSQPIVAPATALPVDRMMLTGDQSQLTTALSNVAQAGTPQAIVPREPGGNDTLSGRLTGTRTLLARAQWIGDRNFMLARGASFECLLATKLVSTVPGMATCVVPRNVYSDNGKVVLIERGSTVTGEYRADLRAGMTRIFVLWDRIKTTEGAIIPLDSPATGALGEAGIGGDVDNHWGQRIGAALLLSFVQDAIASEITRQNSGGGSNTVILPNTSQQTETLAGKLLDNTINTPPTLTVNQGEKVMVMVARDLDFSDIYGLRVERENIR